MNDVIVSEQTAIAPQQLNEGAAFLSMLQAAVSQGLDIERIRELRQMQKEWQADQAEQAFELAMSEFKRNPPKVVHDLKNKQYNSTYSSLANFVGTVNAALGEHGLSASWELDQSTGIKVTCVLSHRLGHKKRVSMVGPPDNSGAKNPIQQIKSTMTYLELATFQAVTGIVAAAANEDDDGNGADAAYVTTEQAMNLKALAEEVKANEKAFLAYAKADGYESILAGKYSEAVAMLEAKRKRA